MFLGPETVEICNLVFRGRREDGGEVLRGQVSSGRGMSRGWPKITNSRPFSRTDEILLPPSHPHTRQSRWLARRIGH